MHSRERVQFSAIFGCYQHVLSFMANIFFRLNIIHFFFALTIFKHISCSIVNVTYSNCTVSVPFRLCRTSIANLGQGEIRLQLALNVFLVPHIKIKIMIIIKNCDKSANERVCVCICMCGGVEKIGREMEGKSQKNSHLIIRSIKRSCDLRHEYILTTECHQDRPKTITPLQMALFPV